MTSNPSITTLGQKPGHAWGILALIVVAIPLPFLFALNVLSLVVRNQPSGQPTAEATVYALIAFGGLFFFPVLFVAATVLGVTAVRKPRLAAKVMGWVTIAIVILAIPAAWSGYLVWITNAG